MCHKNSIETKRNNDLSFSSNDKDICIVCNDLNDSKVAYYNCSKFHNLCKNCFDAHDNNSHSAEGSKCPMCNAKLLKENQSPSQISIPELINLDLKTINHKHIFIHQNFKLKKTNNLVHITSGNTKIAFYIVNGEIMKYMRMFVAENGFLYSYNEDYECYHVAVYKNKYQFWDSSKISLNL